MPPRDDLAGPKSILLNVNQAETLLQMAGIIVPER
jgi:hypothetical protein